MNNTGSIDKHTGKVRTKAVWHCKRTGTTLFNAGVHTARKQGGIALIMVLWLLILITVIAASHSHTIRTETRLTANHIEAGKARAMAEAGFYHAIMELLVTDKTQRWPVNGTINHLRYDNGELAISIRDARGLLDINQASNALMDKVLTAAGITDKLQRQSLIDTILDWRDRDSLKHINGAEDEDYKQAGMKWSAHDDNFSSIEEFRYILGMTNELFQRLAPYLTIYSGQPDINPEYAPPWLASVLTSNQGASSSGSAGAATGGSRYHISVWATTSGSATASLDAVVHIKPGRNQAYKILSWRIPSRSASVTSG